MSGSSKPNIRIPATKRRLRLPIHRLVAHLSAVVAIGAAPRKPRYRGQTAWTIRNAGRKPELGFANPDPTPRFSGIVLAVEVSFRRLAGESGRWSAGMSYSPSVGQAVWPFSPTKGRWLPAFKGVKAPLPWIPKAAKSAATHGLKSPGDAPRRHPTKGRFERPYSSCHSASSVHAVGTLRLRRRNQTRLISPPTQPGRGIPGPGACPHLRPGISS